MEIDVKSDSAEEETTVLNIMNKEGMERTVEVGGANASVSIDGSDAITIEVPGDQTVSVDGVEQEVVDGQAVSKFPTQEETKPSESETKPSEQIKVKLAKNTASNKLTFTSNKKSVAAVSSDGKVTAKKPGTATVRVQTFNGKKAKLKITANKK